MQKRNGFWGWIFILIIWTVSACTLTEPPASGTLLIRNVQILDLQTGTTSRLSRVMLDGDRIVGIEKEDHQAVSTAIPQLDGQGQFLMPGLWDMHVHMCWLPGLDTLFARVFLQYGVTGVRDMGGDAALLAGYKSWLLEHPAHGPQIYGAGPILDGNPPVFTDFSLALDQESPIAHWVDSLVKMDVDFLKVYSLLDSTSLKRVAERAEYHQIPFAGHLSELVDPALAVDWGQASIEHLNRLEDGWPADLTQLNSLMRAMQARETYVCPTTVIYKKKGEMYDSLAVWRSTDESYIPPVLQAEWRQSRADRLAQYPGVENRQKLNQRLLERFALVNYLHQAGIPILAGSDFAGMPFVYPGYGLHEELALLVEAGLSPLEALQSATILPARFLGAPDRYGQVKEGFQADLILLRANPLKDIRHSSSIVQVVRAGKLISK